MSANKFKHVLKFLGAITVMIGIQSCSLVQSSNKGYRLSDLRPRSSDTVIISKQIPKKTLLEFLSREDLVRNIRVVEIFEREKPGSGPTLKEYRLFNISEHGVYYLLGLRNADVLVAASDVIVAAPELFKDYIRLLAFENEANIEIRRDGKPVLLNLTFTAE